MGVLSRSGLTRLASRPSDVSMSPGMTTLTRTRRGAASLATYAHSPDSAALLAAYAGISVVLTTREAVEEVRTIAAPDRKSGSVGFGNQKRGRRVGRLEHTRAGGV